MYMRMQLWHLEGAVFVKSHEVLGKTNSWGTWWNQSPPMGYLVKPSFQPPLYNSDCVFMGRLANCEQGSKIYLWKGGKLKQLFIFMSGLQKSDCPEKHTPYPRHVLLISEKRYIGWRSTWIRVEPWGQCEIVTNFTQKHLVHKS